MKTLLLGLVLGATSLTAPVVLAAPPHHAQSHHAQSHRGHGSHDRNHNGVRDSREHKRSGVHSRQASRRDNWRHYRNFDYNRPDHGHYYADRYYRDGRYYRPTRVTRNTRIYRGSNGRYYCRRSDGTTGLIVGAAIGGLIGNSLDNGRSSLLGTLLGAGGGALLGREIDRGGLSCR